MRNVSVSHLADPAAFDFAGLDARRSSRGAEIDVEPWEEG